MAAAFPLVVSDLASKEELVDQIIYQIRTNDHPLKYLFWGSAASGKTTAARFISEAVRHDSSVSLRENLTDFSDFDFDCSDSDFKQIKNVIYMSNVQPCDAAFDRFDMIVKFERHE